VAQFAWVPIQTSDREPNPPAVEGGETSAEPAADEGG